MPGQLFRSEEFRTPLRDAAAMVFVCPYGTSIRTVRWAIRRLLRDGCHVLAYQTTTTVFLAAEPGILPDLIAEMREDFRAQISRLRSEGVTEFGFFGSSLGSFILYNCIGTEIPELCWGVFNTGGNIAQGMWRLRAARHSHLRKGLSLAGLEAAWSPLQWPEFGHLEGCRFVFASSRHDKVAPLGNVAPYLVPLRRAGAEVSVVEVPAVGHLTAVIAGLWLAPRLVRMARAGGGGLCHRPDGRRPGPGSP